MRKLWGALKAGTEAIGKHPRAPKNCPVPNNCPSKRHLERDREMRPGGLLIRRLRIERIFVGGPELYIIGEKEPVGGLL